MSDIAIRVENLGKRYRLARTAGPAGYRTLREELVQAPARLWSALSSPAEPDDEFWALRDVSFEVKQGEVLGVIGRNGAGKSTLLKILSRIVEPTTGGVDLYGRVGSLLEVGTGFHPELTGRENIFLSGAMLGMRRPEVRARLDEIVAFSEVEKFIDTPCKHYSSGMYTRLGFAVAAHLRTDILMVDEVLAVGDVGFQQKCLGKMSTVAQSGRTVLFISHNLAALRRLCTTALLLDGGCVLLAGSVADCLSQYLRAIQPAEIGPVTFERCGLRLDEFVTQNPAGGSQAVFSTVEPIVVILSIALTKNLAGLRCGFELVYEETSEVVFLTFDDDWEERAREVGVYRFKAIIPANLLKAGRYRLAFLAGVHNRHWISKDEVIRAFTIENVAGVNARYNDSRSGLVAPLIQWEINT